MTSPKNPNPQRPSFRRAAVAGAGLALTAAVFGGHSMAGAQARPTVPPAAAAPCGTGGTLVLSGPTGAGQSSSLPAGIYTSSGHGLVPCAEAVETRAARATRVSVTVTNDAAGTGFGIVEFARSPGANVAFRVVVNNTSEAAVRISKVSVPNCTGLVGRTLAAGAGAACNYSLAGYSPARGTSRVNSVAVTACEVAHGRRCATTTSTSEVITMAATGAASGGQAARAW